MLAASAAVWTAVLWSRLAGAEGGWQVPLLVRTDARGLVVSAFAGVPTADDLNALGYPWQASTAGGG